MFLHCIRTVYCLPDPVANDNLPRGNTTLVNLRLLLTGISSPLVAGFGCVDQGLCGGASLTRDHIPELPCLSWLPNRVQTISLVWMLPDSSRRRAGCASKPRLKSFLSLLGPGAKKSGTPAASPGFDPAGPSPCMLGITTERTPEL